MPISHLFNAPGSSDEDKLVYKCIECDQKFGNTDPSWYIGIETLARESVKDVHCVPVIFGKSIGSDLAELFEDRKRELPSGVKVLDLSGFEGHKTTFMLASRAYDLLEAGLKSRLESRRERTYSEVVSRSNPPSLVRAVRHFIERANREDDWPRYFDEFRVVGYPNGFVWLTESQVVDKKLFDLGIHTSACDYGSEARLLVGLPGLSPVADPATTPDYNAVVRLDFNLALDGFHIPSYLDSRGFEYFLPYGESRSFGMTAFIQDRDKSLVVDGVPEWTHPCFPLHDNLVRIDNAGLVLYDRTYTCPADGMLTLLNERERATGGL